MRLLLRRRFVLGRVGSHAARQVPDCTPIIKHGPILPPCADLQVLLLRYLSPILLPPVLYAGHEVELPGCWWRADTGCDVRAVHE